MYSMPHLLSKTLKIMIYEPNFLKLQQFQYFAMILNSSLFWLGRQTRTSWFILSACLWKRTCVPRNWPKIKHISVVLPTP